MASQTAVQTRMIVIPNELESFFYGRLSERYRDRCDVQVIVDRRRNDRRRSESCEAGASSSPERRSSSRRNEGPCWSLADMPFSAS